MQIAAASDAASEGDAGHERRNHGKMRAGYRDQMRKAHGLHVLVCAACIEPGPIAEHDGGKQRRPFPAHAFQLLLRPGAQRKKDPGHARSFKDAHVGCLGLDEYAF